MPGQGHDAGVAEGARGPKSASATRSPDEGPPTYPPVPADWPAPRCAVRSDREARPGYDTVDASEYLDADDVLDRKVAVLADMLRASRQLCLYSGAGLSTAAGIGDYASRAKGTLSRLWVKGAPKPNLRSLEPTLAHRVLASLARPENGALLKQWVQQNHDGLAHKVRGRLVPLVAGRRRRPGRARGAAPPRPGPPPPRAPSPGAPRRPTPTPTSPPPGPRRRPPPRTS